MSRSRPSNWDSIRKKVYQRDNHQCQNCGRRGGPYGDIELHAHHIVALSKGGTNKMSNLTTVCKGCHNSIHGSAMAPTEQSDLIESHSEDIPPYLGPYGIASLLVPVVASLFTSWLNAFIVWGLVVWLPYIVVVFGVMGWDSE